MAYITTAQLRAFVRDMIVENDDEIAAAVLTACRAVNTHCGRAFDVPTEVTSRSWISDGSGLQELDDIATPADVAVTVDGSAVSGWSLESVPGIVDQYAYGLVRPLRWVRSLPADRGATITVAARWGWPAVPTEVVQAAKLLGKDVLQGRDVSFGTQTFGPEAFARKITSNTIVVALLADLTVDRITG